MRAFSALLLLLVAAGCAAGDDSGAALMTDGVEAYSLIGEPLVRPTQDAETRATLEANLAEAQAQYDTNPNDADAIIWLGRRFGYLGRYQEAVTVFTEGIEKHPDDARMFRHRGHRNITVRNLEGAVADFERAVELIQGQPDEVEPDGAPNPYGIPRSTLQSNIWYHLGLAHYLLGDFESALEAYLECMEVSENDDMLVATADWLYMTYRRLGREEEAAEVLDLISADMEILENDSYHRRLLMYKGELPPEELLSDTADALQMATQGYGVGNWYLYNDDPERAREIFEQVLSYGNWAAFGHIAAESDLLRMGAS
ncbi:MAG: tetratricopeptide repeat protein [Gemmatimonadota bacterium]